MSRVSILAFVRSRTPEAGWLAMYSAVVTR